MTKDAKPQAKKPQKDSSTGLWLDAAGVSIRVGDTLKCIRNATYDEDAWYSEAYAVVGDVYKVVEIVSTSNEVGNEWLPINVFSSTCNDDQWVIPTNYLVI